MDLSVPSKMFLSISLIATAANIALLNCRYRPSQPFVHFSSSRLECNYFTRVPFPGIEFANKSTYWFLVNKKSISLLCLKQASKTVLLRYICYVSIE